MKSLQEYNPVGMLIFFVLAAGIPMFSGNPALNALSLAGSLLFFRLLSGGGDRRSGLFFFLLFLLTALLNPLFNHSGNTVLFFVNDNPVTLEALLYGVNQGAMILSVLCWFRAFTLLFTDDRLLYLFGNISPKLALILSMVLRSVPRFRKQAVKVRELQKSLGLFRGESAWDNIRGGMAVFSVLVTWGLENGIITADSMSARGYGTGRRTSFSRFRFRRSDAALIGLLLLLGIPAVIGAVSGALDFSFYPELSEWVRTPGNAISLWAYGALALLPSVMETGERLKWKYLQSGI